MSIDTSNLHYPVKNHLERKISIPPAHFLVKLDEVINWEFFAELAIADLYSNKKRSGRKLNIRLHLGAFILQLLFRWTDRELEENLNFYIPARAFCGIEDKAYDHSAYVKFRNRISEETATKFNSSLIKVACKKGFTSSKNLDFDSTVQEANIEYPSDALMMKKLIKKSERILKRAVEKGSRKAKEVKDSFDFKGVYKLFKGYFFSVRGEQGKLIKKKIFKQLHKASCDIVEKLYSLNIVLKKCKLPWNLKRELNDILNSPLLLSQIDYFINKDEVAEEKIMSLHAKEVKCIRRGKLGKMNEFGRKWFVGRVDGNYAYGFSDQIKIEDNKSFEKGLKKFFDIFDSGPSTVTGDQGFWSEDNINACSSVDVKEIGISPRGRAEWLVEADKVEGLKNRRAGIEPIIGHLKRRGLGKSKMKTDRGTKLEGQRSFISLNLARLAKDLTGGSLKWSG